MITLTNILMAWFILTGLLIIIPIFLATIRMRLAQTTSRTLINSSIRYPCDILIPVKGPITDEGSILRSLLEQDHSAYYVTFIIESEDDPAKEVLDVLCKRFSHARTLVSTPSTSCCQKNQNLIKGVNHLHTETKIIVFCDSSNEAPSGWLARFVQPLENDSAQVVTTFRSFDPQPQTLGGICQTLYGTVLLAMMVLLPYPKPWGGATAIRRDVFEELDVKREWAHTIVDDLILGNVLDRAGIRVKLDLNNLLRTPLQNQTIKQFTSYLDRQIMFPKFTNPMIWLLSLLSHIDLPLSFTVAIVMSTILFPAGLVNGSLGMVALAYLGAVVLAAFLLRTLNPFSISFVRWLVAILPCTTMAAFIFLRSIFRNYIVWNGRKYIPGREGVILAVMDDRQ